MKTKYLLTTAVIFLLSTSCAQYGANSDKIANDTCPQAIVPPHHDITVNFHNPLPSKLQVILDGVEKVNDCKELVQSPPIVKAYHLKDNQSLDVLVQHFGAYKVLPKTVSVQINDLGQCRDNPREIFSVENANIKFEKSYPYGESCGSRITGSLEFNQ